MKDVQFGSVAAVFPVADVETSIVWYEEMLGFKAKYVNRDPDGEDPTNYAVLQRDRAWLHLMLRFGSDVGSVAEAAFFRKLEVATAHFTVEGVNGLFDLLGCKGVRVVRDLQDQPWGSRDFTIEDLDGNWIRLSQDS